ncbi:50S ribosomal protein L11 methyltransferase [Candidatus Rickettsiella isopodorum]|jgi:ribosomal protein L11 methyltransferase|nr:50S ribosomal protein L11 methyltransferase [Candidatus Rickettsiella isopodorum]
MMACLQLHLNTQREHTERLSEFLENASALSITWQALDEQSVYEPPLDSTPLWQQVKISAVFPEHTSLSALMDALHQEFNEKIILASHSEILADQAWERLWLNDFKPMRFGKKIWICPSAYEPPVKTAVNIRLDPGLAFGTGTHPSTALCLEWLDSQRLQNKTVIDYGCGSGILAIAAVKCGAKQVIAVDHDPQALAATTMNAEKNEISAEKLKIFLPIDFQSQEPVDIFLANILAQPLIDLATYFRSLVKSGAYCILAGILNEQIEPVQQAYRVAGFKIMTIHHQQEWVSLVGSAV